MRKLDITLKILGVIALIEVIIFMTVTLVVGIAAVHALSGLTTDQAPPPSVEQPFQPYGERPYEG